MMQLVDSSTDWSAIGEWNRRLWNAPATMVSTGLKDPLDWPNATGEW
jgi:hypothetical protein